MSDEGHAPLRVLDYSGPVVDWVTIAVFGRSAEWFGACHRLIPYGVDCRIGRDDSPVHDALLCNVAGGVSLQVRRAEAGRALDILRALGGGGHAPITHPELGAELGNAG